jgi:chromosome segregation ATPase
MADETTYTQDQVDEQIKAALAKETEGLKAKRDELLADVRKQKDDKAELNDRLQKLEDSQEDAARAKAEAEGNVDEIKAQVAKEYDRKLERLQKDLDASAQKYEAEHGVNKRLLIDNGLTDALTQAGVAKELMPAARARLKEQGIELEDIEGERQARIDGKDISEYVSEWSQGDEGRHFISAANNGGGGANGANGGGQAAPKLSDMNESERVAFAQRDPDGFRRAANIQ